MRHSIPTRDNMVMELVVPAHAPDVTPSDKPQMLPVADKSRIHILSHEVRTPLTGIIGFTQLIRDDIKEDTHLLSHLDWLERSTQNLRSVMETWLEAASLEVGHLENRPRYASLKDVLQPLLDSYQQIAKRKKLSFQVRWPKSDRLYVDTNLLQSIVRHLVDNAVKFTEVGGVKVVFQSVDRRLRISVTDTGIGFDTDHLLHLFEPYRQASQGLSRRYAGCGLGLSVVKGYVDHLHGQTHFESVPGEGTKAVVELPLHHLADEVNIRELDRSKRILYVEDDPVIQMLCRRLLNNFLIDTCFTGEEALERIKSVRYDAVMVDVQLGKGMTGVQLCQALRKREAYKSVPIAAVTAMGYNVVMDLDQRLFSHYLPKPFDKRQLLAFVEQLTQPEPYMSV
jgi:CheY-like chemotaxis protein